MVFSEIGLWLLTTLPTLRLLKHVLKIGKVENAGNYDQMLSFEKYLHSVNMERSEIFLCGKGLNKKL